MANPTEVNPMEVLLQLREWAIQMYDADVEQWQAVLDVVATGPQSPWPRLNRHPNGMLGSMMFSVGNVLQDLTQRMNEATAVTTTVLERDAEGRPTKIVKAAVGVEIWAVDKETGERMFPHIFLNPYTADPTDQAIESESE